jgi:hypothetical protein
MSISLVLRHAWKSTPGHWRNIEAAKRNVEQMAACAKTEAIIIPVH